MTKKQYLRIGNEVASISGGECLGYDLEEDGSVNFYCIEHGERYYVTISKDDLKNYLPKEK